MQKIQKFQGWFKGLSSFGKVGMIAAAIFVGSSIASAGTNTSDTAPEAPQSSVAAATETAPKKDTVTTKIETTTEAIPFEQQTMNSTTLAKGTTQVQIPGVNGVKTFTHTITLTNGVETKRTTSEAVTTAPTAQVSIVGTYVKPAPAPAPVQAPRAAAASNCDPNYSGCVPNVSYDLDCKDIGFRVQVLGTDKHRFDADRDGYGCESY